MEGSDVLSEGLAGRLKRPPEIGVLPVHLVDEENATKPVLLGETPDLIGADFDTSGGVDDDHRALDDAHRAQDLSEKIGVARRVEDVDLGVLPLDGYDGRADGDVTLDLVGVEVRCGVAFFHPAEAGDRFGVEEEGFGQRGFAGTAVREEANVPDAFGGIPVHVVPPGILSHRSPRKVARSWRV